MSVGKMVVLKVELLAVLMANEMVANSADTLGSISVVWMVAWLEVRLVLLSVKTLAVLKVG